MKDTTLPKPSLHSLWGALWRRRLTLAKAAIVLIVAVFIGLAVLINTMPDRVDEQQTIVLGQTAFVPDSLASLRVVVRDFASALPIPDAVIRIALAPKDEAGPARTLYEGHADTFGTAQVSFYVPADLSGEQTLIVETSSPVGKDRVTKAVTVERSYKILLTSDKPLYQPGQTVHLRALALSALDMTPARNQPLNFLIEDPKGNKVFRQTATTSEYGIAAADFELASEVNTGSYKLSASLGDTTSEKTVTVKPYVLPKFKVNVAADKTFYLPGERVVGYVQADYFFGKPTAEAEVTIRGYVYDVERREVVEIVGQTDEQGHFAFAFDLPTYLVGGGLEQDQAEFGLEVAVTDQARHTEQTSKVLPIAQEPIVIEAVPESGELKPGVENILYILTAYPDGLPAETRLTVEVNGELFALDSGHYGLAELRYTPTRPYAVLRITAQDASGRQASKQVEMTAADAPEHVLLRADRAVYQVGETMHLEVLASTGRGTAYLDIVKEGQTLSTRAAEIADGRAALDIDLVPELFGTLQLHAYKVLHDGTIVRDSRLVVVDPPSDLDLAITTDRAEYRPGEVAQVAFRTEGQAGPVQSALGIAVVDESVFALQEQDPGFAKLYFLLEQELREPRYQIKGFQLPGAMPPEDEAEVRQVQDQSAHATWADAPVQDFDLRSDSRIEKLRRVVEDQIQAFKDLTAAISWPLLLIPIILWGVVLYGLRGSGVLKKALKRLVASAGVALFALPFVACFLFAFASLVYRTEGIVFYGVVLAWLIALLTLGVYAWVSRDERVKFACVLAAAFAALGVLLAFGNERSGEPNLAVMLFLGLACLAYLVAIYLLGVGLWIEGRRTAAVSAIALAVLLLPAIVAAAAMPQVTSPLVRTLGDPALYVGPMGWLTGCAPLAYEAPPQPTQAPAVELEKEAAAPGQAATEAPRLRQYFPETLYWNPEAVTDSEGFLALDIPLADSITTWRLTALASSQRGELGMSTLGIRVFQDFFIDLDLPVSLTQGDEVSIPVAVYNYLPEAQTVRLEVAEADWFELHDALSKELTIASNDIEVVYFRLQVTRFGRQALRVTAWGERMSDAIQKEVAIVPDGKEIRQTASDWLQQTTVRTLNIPAQAIEGTARIEVKVYPGVVSQIVEGLEKIMRMPFG